MFVALAILAALAVLVAATRRRRPTTTLSSETVRQDRSHSPFLPAPTTGRDVERAAADAARAARGAVVPVASAPVAITPGDSELIGVTRRQFFNRSALAMMTLGLTGFGSAVLAFLWPRPSGAFGSKVTAGRVDELLQRIDDAREPVYLAEARTFLSRYPKESLDKARGSYPSSVLPGMEAGIIACTRSALISAAGSRSAPRHSGSSAPATGLSTRASARRRVAPRPAAWICSRSRSRTAP